MDDLIPELGRVLKYQRDRLPVAGIHPQLRFTRLGAILREFATEPSDVGELAHQAITSPHDQPLELMPLHLLRDKMQEEPDHPLAEKVVWSHLPERVSHDQRVHSYFGRITNGIDLAASGQIAGIRHNVEQFLRDNGDMVENDIAAAAGRIRAKLGEERISRGLPDPAHYQELQHQALAGRTFIPFSEQHYGPPL